jgi:dihydroorotate dehydrogenase (NAD+) catalytic subunit
MHNKLEIEFLGKKAKNPLVLPAGIMDLSYSGMKFAVENGVGIVTSKSLTLSPRSGHPTPVVAEFTGGMLNSMGLCNPGIEEGILEINRFKEECDVPLIASVFATCEADFVKLIDKVNHSKADFVELNLSCPNVFDEFGIPLAASTEKVASIVKAVKEISTLPVIAKLSPNVYDIVSIAMAAESAGADALSLINTVGPGMAIDIHTVNPVLHNKFGGLSGPCVKPIALKLVYQVYSEVSIPIIGMGGITTGEDAVEMLMAGATAIGVGSAVYYRGMDVFNKICTEIVDYLDEKKMEHVSCVPKLEKMK